MTDEELQNPLLDHQQPTGTGEVREGRRASRLNPVSLLVGGVLVATVALLSVVYLHTLKWTQFKSHHGHVSYQTTMKSNNDMVYTREFTAPCSHGILVFNVGPAVSYLPYKYDIYQDAYVYSNNKKMCWLYPTYRGIQKGPFPWWNPGDPTSFDVPTGSMATKISSRVVKPRDAKNVTTPKGGDFLIIQHGKFYTPAFYQNLRRKINGWRDEDFGNFEGFLDGWTEVEQPEEWEGAGSLEIEP